LGPRALYSSYRIEFMCKILDQSRTEIIRKYIISHNSLQLSIIVRWQTMIGHVFFILLLWKLSVLIFIIWR